MNVLRICVSLDTHRLARVSVTILILGAGGIATLWEAVFADVGVALLAIMNAVRIQKMIK